MWRRASQRPKDASGHRATRRRLTTTLATDLVWGGGILWSECGREDELKMHFEQTCSIIERVFALVSRRESAPENHTSSPCFSPFSLRRRRATHCSGRSVLSTQRTVQQALWTFLKVRLGRSETTPGKAPFPFKRPTVSTSYRPCRRFSMSWARPTCGRTWLSRLCKWLSPNLRAPWMFRHSALSRPNSQMTSASSGC